MQLNLSPATPGGTRDSGPTTSPARLWPYLAAGVVLTGAALIGANPVVSTTLADPQERAVQLTSSDDWGSVFTDAFANLQQIGTEIAADPAPVLTQVIENQTALADTLNTNLETIGNTLSTFASDGLPQALQALSSGIQSGDISDAVNDFNTALLLGLIGVAQPIQTILGLPGETAQNFANVVETLPTVGLNILLAPLGPLDGTFQAWGDSSQGIVEAVNAGDWTTALTDLLNQPAVLAGALLNGYDTSFGIDYSGLLTPGIAGIPFTGGLLDSLLVGLPETIAQALGASATDAAAAAADPTSILDLLASI